MTNNHSAEARKALDHLKSLAATLDGWSLNAEKDNVTIYSREVEGAPPMTRGDTILEAGWTLEQIAAIIQCPGARKIWDERFDSAEIKERFNRRELLFHSKMKGTWPVSGRDIVGISIFEKDSKEYVIASKSVEEPSIPAASSHIRADVLVSGWILRALDGGKIGITYIVHINLNGTISQTFLKLVQNQTPLCAGKVADYARKFGFPPYVKSVEGRLRIDDFDHSNKIYTVEADALEEHGFLGGKTGTVIIEVPKKLYPNGFSLKNTLAEDISQKEEEGNTIVTIKSIKAPVTITISRP